MHLATMNAWALHGLDTYRVNVYLFNAPLEPDKIKDTRHSQRSAVFTSRNS